jgi:hypothetical protein
MAPAPPTAAKAAPPATTPPIRPSGCWFIWWDPCGLGSWSFGMATVLLVDFVTTAKVVAPWLGGLTAPAALGALAPFQLLIALILVSYWRAATTDPGTVIRGTATPEDAAPDPTDPDYVWKPRRRYCDKCAALKPPRAHHCSTCGRCIMRMDECTGGRGRRG